tara:strand:- start:8369 stop:8605 length:237 start_codon:yes stop_codon:yes gene_type:complete
MSIKNSKPPSPNSCESRNLTIKHETTTDFDHSRTNIHQSFSEGEKAGISKNSDNPKSKTPNGNSSIENPPHSPKLQRR